LFLYLLFCYLGNGYPVAAVICKREVADAFAKSGIEYFNTYGGNSVACAISEAVLDTIINEDLQKNALEVGNYLTEQLMTLFPKYEWIGEIRGVGLFQGIEFVKDRNVEEIEPYPDLTKFLVDFLRYQRVIVSRDGPDANVIKIKPPLVFSKENVDQLVKSLDKALACAKSFGHF
jgi:ethanolamine-phosphate phospho-lyase